MRDCDVLFVQEHWLYRCRFSKLAAPGGSYAYGVQIWPEKLVWKVDVEFYDEKQNHINCL